MWPVEGEVDRPRWSFHHPLPVIGEEPDAGVLYCVSFNQKYLKVICGALCQLLLRQTWDASDPVAQNLQQERCYSLLKMFALAEACPVQEDGLQLLTIPAGDATVSVDIVFVSTYAAIPKVDVSCDNGSLIASWGDVTLTGFTVTLTAATPVTVDTTATISWSTNP